MSSPVTQDDVDSVKDVPIEEAMNYPQDAGARAARTPDRSVLDPSRPIRSTATTKPLARVLRAYRTALSFTDRAGVYHSPELSRAARRAVA